MRHRKTDYGTVILHWLFVAAFAVALFSGLRIATESPERTWINLFDVLLPRDSVWIAHMQAAVVLVALALGYIVYVIKAGLGRRIQLDGVRLRGLFGRGPSRLAAVNACLTWIFFVTMLALLVSGGLLYFGFYSGYDVAMLHWVGTWVILAFTVLHVVTQYKSGGAAQLLRIFRPAPLPAPPPRLDAVELLNLLMEQQAAHPIQPGDHPSTTPGGEADPAPRQQVRKARSKNATLQANAFVVAAAAALTGASVIVATDRMSVDQLQIHRINSAEAPTLDGDILRPGVAIGQAIFADHRRRRQFRRQGRNPDRNPRRA